MKTRKTDLSLKDNLQGFIEKDLYQIIKNKVYLFLSIERGERLFNRSKSFGIKNYIGENITPLEFESLQIIFNSEFADLDPEHIRYINDSAEFDFNDDGSVIYLRFYFSVLKNSETVNVNLEMDLK